MKNKVRPKTKSFIMIAAMFAFTLLAYQNCSNSAFFTASENLNSIVGVTVIPQYANRVAGESDSFPPLKLLFVVDNSGTMEANQINLSNAFDRMFSGSNATNLAPFDTTAFVVSTSQHSPDKTSAVFAKLPTASVDSFASNPSSLLANRSPYLSGLVPGDLVGFGLSVANLPEKKTTSFYPAPVALFPQGSSTASRFSHKAKNGSVDAFSADFKERIAVLNPAKSDVDPVSNRGVLDDVIDNESGLCGVARVLRNNSGFFNPGDLASVVIVSDENDQDASGRSCYDSIIEAKSGVNYIDGRCEQPQTRLQFRAEVVNPSKAKCRVVYDTGFSYRVNYKMPTTDAKYHLKSMTYDQLKSDVSYYTSTRQFNQLRTAISYYTSKMVYDSLETPVTYFTKAPTYEIPRTKVTYYVENESCTIRDGVKFNCQYSYSVQYATLEGDFGSQCATFITGKLPAGALYNKAGYQPQCALDTPLAKSGACSTTNTDIRNCKQNYSNVKTVTLSGQVTSTCAAFYNGRLPAGALTAATADPDNQPACGTLIVTKDKVGACTTSDLDKKNCSTVYTATSSPTVVNGIPGSATCNAFAKTKLAANSNAIYDLATYPVTCASAESVATTGSCSETDANVSDCRTVYSAVATMTLNGRPGSKTCEEAFKSKLPSNTVLSNANYPISCKNGTTATNVAGNCSTTDANVENCKYVFSTQKSVNLEGALDTKTCAEFVAGRLPSGATYTDADYLPTCSTGTNLDKVKSGNELYSNWKTYTPVANTACSDDVKSSVLTSNALVIASGTTPTCTITALTSDNETLSDPNAQLTCAVANWRNVCDGSSAGKRNCVPTDIPAGDKYETATTTRTYDGQFTCNSLCTETSFCKDKTGTLAENYYQCAATPSAAIVKSTFVLESESFACSAGLNRVVTNGPYQTTATRPTYVAGAKSEANSITALSDMILERSREIFNASLPIVSVFVRQPGDSLGTNGSLGTEYNRLADLFGGKKLSVLSTATQYASALEDLSGKIRQRLGQSVNFSEVGPGQEVRKVWLRGKNTSDFLLVDEAKWSASGGTITLVNTVNYGDEFRIEFW